MPVSSQDRDSIRWTKGEREKFIRNMESKAFGEQLYRLWDLEPEYNYRAVGRLVSVNQKVMLLFDFNQPEWWRSQKIEGQHE